ncbi:hypothetical protein LEP1GSC188_4128 [Leptospira weilii serovar Topaz str. LT2116]|uniref:Uncharacterized protein n=1 Tax=Leptospira weilii serovar Topaz str. LT2116 TaxID=1088540 RepID=M3GDG8_9LEPT|nr:hypothetical protein LEP1GSC188_4128 [Leptospira weilii serovar Topaz str. LT2116]
MTKVLLSKDRVSDRNIRIAFAFCYTKLTLCYFSRKNSILSTKTD